MTLLVILKPPGGGTDIELHAERVDYTINNEIIHKLAGTEEGRCVQVISGVIQMNITGVCIEENGKTAMENIQIIESAINTWADSTRPSSISSYPKVNWRIGDEYMLMQKLTFTEEGQMDNNEIDYLLTLYIDTRT